MYPEQANSPPAAPLVKSPRTLIHPAFALYANLFVSLMLDVAPAIDAAKRNSETVIFTATG
jgi:hypothetical protein